MTIYLCTPDFEGILCGVYDAWMSRKGHENVRLELKNVQLQRELFSEYIEVQTDEGKAAKVRNAVCGKLSQTVYQQIYIAALSSEPGRADAIYRFLVQAFRYGKGILDMLQLQEVYEVFRICRSVINESHKFTEFIRFSQTEKNVLLGRISPRADVLVLLASHFADRLREENWMIYDENRKKAILHPKGGQWLVAENIALEEEGEGEKGAEIWKNCLDSRTDEEEYRQLWQAFFETVAIEQRKNPSCQKNHLPLRFRAHMTEFQGENG